MDLFGEMVRKKLRNCTKCGVRHGPPIGTRCKRAEEEFSRLNAEMNETPKFEDKGDVVETEQEAVKIKDADRLSNTNSEEDKTTRNAVPGQECLPDQDLPSFSEFRRQKEAERSASMAREDPDETGQHGQQGPSSADESQPGFYYQVPWQFVPPHLREVHRYPPMFRGDPPSGFGPGPAKDPRRQRAAEEPTAVNADFTSDSRPASLEGVMELMIKANEGPNRDSTIVESRCR